MSWMRRATPPHPMLLQRRVAARAASAMGTKLACEGLGVLLVVLVGCGAAVLGASVVGQAGVALAFGCALAAATLAFGPISGAHLNPAVSFAMFLAGRVGVGQMLMYWSAQFIGAVAGAALLAVISGQAEALGQNGWGPGFLGGYGLQAATVFELAMSTLFILVALLATAPDTTTHGAPNNANLPAAFSLGATLAGIHLVGLTITGVSVNPARSLGPALLVGGEALQQLWLFFWAPMAGAVLAVLIYRGLLGRPGGPPQTRL